MNSMNKSHQRLTRRSGRFAIDKEILEFFYGGSKKEI